MNEEMFSSFELRYKPVLLHRCNQIFLYMKIHGVLFECTE